MASLQIDLFDKTNDRRIWVMLRDNLPVQDLINKLIQDLELPQKYYVLIDEENNLTLPQESTLADENIQDQHTLRIEPKSKIAPVPVPIPVKKDKTGKTTTDSGSSEKTGKGKASAKKKPASPKPQGKTPISDNAYNAHSASGKKMPANRPIKPWLRRPFRRPSFLRGIPNNIWNFITPFSIIVILIFLFIICFVVRCVNNQQPLAAMGGQDDSPAEFDEPIEEEKEELVEPEDEVAEFILPDLDQIHLSLPDIESNYPGVCYAVFNTEEEPFNDIKLREVFAHAIDREYISQNWTCDDCQFREQQPASTLNPEEFYTTKSGADFYSKWVKVELPAGYSAEEIAFELYSPENDAGLAELVAANWKEYLGVEVELASQDFDTFVDTLDSANPPDAYVWCNYLDKDSPVDMLLLLVADYYGNYIRWDPPVEYYQAVLEGYENNDEEAYLQAEKILIEEYFVVAPIFSYNVD